MTTAFLLSSVLMGFQIAPQPLPPGEIPIELLPAAQVAKVRAEIAAKIGGKDDDRFLIVFKQANPATIPVGTPLPAGAQLLPGNRWLETVFQPELVESKEAAINLLVKYYVFAKQRSEAGEGIYDWKLIGKYGDEETANKKYEEAVKTAAETSATYRPRTKEALSFFNSEKPDFFEKVGKP